MNLREVYDRFNEALQPVPVDEEAREIVAEIGRAVGVDIFTDIEGGDVWTHTNLHRVLVAVMSMRHQLAQVKGFDSYAAASRTDTVFMPRVSA